MATATEGLQPAVGYIRVSTKNQQKGWSPEVQRQGILDFAAREGYRIVAFEEDVKQGRIKTREGYLRVLAGVKAGLYHAVIVYAFDRAGRDSGEFHHFASELWRARTPFGSVRQGWDKPGIGRAVHAGMAEEEVMRIAQRIRPTKERSVRDGNHIGPTPFGYKRVYPPRESGSRRELGLLTPVDPHAAAVKGLFERAAAGWPIRALALWMNDNPGCPPPGRAPVWSSDSIAYILHNPVYYGHISYNKQSTGYYDHCEPGDEFICPGKHKGIITQDLYDRVQARIEAARSHEVRTRIARPTPFAAGVLVCAACGGKMTLSRRADGTQADRYVCCNGKLGRNDCQTPGYLCSLAHDALLAQIARLQGHPWQPQALDRVVAADPTEEQRAALQAGLQNAQAAMTRHITRFSAQVEDPTPQEIAAHRAVGKELSAQIADLEAALAALPVVTITASDLGMLHREIARLELGTITANLAAIGDDLALRDLVLKLVDSAHVVDRVPALHSRWVRVAVTWTRNVQLLIDAGLLTLAPDVASPDIPTDPIERRRARQREYRRRERAHAS